MENNEHSKTVEAAAAKASHRAILGRVSGAIGGTLLLSTPLTWLLTESMGPLVWGKLLLGALLLAGYAATNADFINKMVGSRSTSLLATSALSASMILGLVAVVNYISFQHPKEFDATREGIYTLTDQTQKIIKHLQEPVHIVAFYASFEQPFAPTKEILQRYAKLSSLLTFEMVDPQNRPDLVEKYQITEKGHRVVVINQGVDAKIKELNEQEITQAIIKVLEKNVKLVYFLTGHDEGNSEDSEQAEGFKAFSEAISSEGYHTGIINLLESTTVAQMGQAEDALGQANELSIPKDIHTLILIAPKKPLLPPEVVALQRYLEKGGRLLVFSEPGRLSGLESTLSNCGILLQQDFIVDTNPLNRLLGLGAGAPMIQPSPNGHSISKNLRAPVIMMTARSLKMNNAIEGINVEPIAMTGDSAWGETKLASNANPSLDAEDNRSPLYVALSSSFNTSREQDKITGEARLVVFGDSDWVSNHYLGMQGNKDLVLNALGWLTEQEDAITIRPQGRNASLLYLSGEQLGQLKFFSMDILPVMLVATGLGIVLIRRQR